MSGAENDNETVKCPYNAEHLVPRSSLVPHILECRRIYGDVVLRKCPFNPSHVVPEEEYVEHITNCLDSKLYTQRESDAVKEEVLVRHAPIECDENWDDVDVDDYNPEKYLATANVLRRKDGPFPKTKMWYKYELKRQQRSCGVTEPTVPLKPLQVKKEIKTEEGYEEEKDNIIKAEPISDNESDLECDRPATPSPPPAPAIKSERPTPSPSPPLVGTTHLRGVSPNPSRSPPAHKGYRVKYPGMPSYSDYGRLSPSPLPRRSGSPVSKRVYPLDYDDKRRGDLSPPRHRRRLSNEDAYDPDNDPYYNGGGSSPSRENCYDDYKRDEYWDGRRGVYRHHRGGRYGRDYGYYPSPYYPPRSYGSIPPYPSLTQPLYDFRY